jgi:hypothetical protein
VIVLDIASNSFIQLKPEFDSHRLSIRSCERDRLASVSPSVDELRVHCTVKSYSGGEAECEVLMDGLELPRVGFPAAALKAKGLEIGGRFIWIMRDASHIQPNDIHPLASLAVPETTAEEENFRRLHDAFRNRLAEDGGVWPVYDGPSR